MNDDFMDFIGYRDGLMEEQIEEALSSASPEEYLSNIDTNELTFDEIDYIKDEVNNRK